MSTNNKQKFSSFIGQRWIYVTSFTFVIGYESGLIIYNVFQGVGPFFSFDFFGKFSIDNKFFIPYWGVIIASIHYVISDADNLEIPSKKNLDTFNSEINPPKTILKNKIRKNPMSSAAEKLLKPKSLSKTPIKQGKEKVTASKKTNTSRKVNNQSSSVEIGLKRIEGLFKKSLITDKERTAMRKKILGID